jgi:NADPH-dependent glutamate synthase beta subunit-like oxidoreductase
VVRCEGFFLESCMNNEEDFLFKYCLVLTDCYNQNSRHFFCMDTDTHVKMPKYASTVRRNQKHKTIFSHTNTNALMCNFLIKVCLLMCGKVFVVLMVISNICVRVCA